MDECNCGWCGRCAAQLEWDRFLEDTGGWHTPKGSEDSKTAYADSIRCGNGCGCDTRCMFPEG
jgi:hypothetical protein